MWLPLVVPSCRTVASSETTKSQGPLLEQDVAVDPVAFLKCPLVQAAIQGDCDVSYSLSYCSQDPFRALQVLPHLPKALYCSCQLILHLH